MATYQTENGYIANETISGTDIYDGDRHICTLQGMFLDDYRDDNDEIDDDALEKDIEEEVEIEEFLDYQRDYC